MNGKKAQNGKTGISVWEEPSQQNTTATVRDHLKIMQF